MDDVVISDVPGGIDAELTLTFRSGSEITTAVGSTVTAWVQHPTTEAKTAATTATVVDATTLRVKWPYGTLEGVRYYGEVYLTPPAGTPGRAWHGYFIVSPYLGA